MKRILKKSIVLLMILTLALGLAACSQSEEKSDEVNTKEVANDYYIDLTDLGMKLTLYLRLDEAGNFLFSNTLDFEVNKSSGTFQKTENEYVMVYSSVNGEEKSVSDGLTSSFVVMEDGSLDFSGCDGIYYGSAKANADSADDPNAKLIAMIVPEDYEAPDQGSDFQAGIYTAEDVTQEGVTYSHTVSFFEDNTYLHLMRYEENGEIRFSSETGTYGVSTTQLALEPGEGSGHDNRVESEVVDDSHLKLSVLSYAGAEERSQMEFSKVESVEALAELSGTGTVKGSEETFEVTVTIYGDGSYESTADGFTENGMLVLNSAEGYVKQYPDHPETAVRGLNQVTTVPSGTYTYEDGKLNLAGLRIRKSAGLARHECTVTE